MSAKVRRQITISMRISKQYLSQVINHKITRNYLKCISNKIPKFGNPVPSQPGGRAVDREAAHGTGRALDEEPEHTFQFSRLQQRSQPSNDDHSI